MLKSDQLRRIVDIQLEQLRRRLEDRHITLDLEPALVDHIAQVGYEPDYGARPLKRAIQRELETPLAKAMLEGSVRDGQNIVASLGPKGVVFGAGRVSGPVGAA
jgi:ATP-dependent Clp protease ATP-binding subunit ClpB